MRRRTTLVLLGACLSLWVCQRPAAAAAMPEYSAEALYDQGNAYARAGKPGLAILNYERARLLAPGDPDLEANLRYVRRSSHLPDEPRPWFYRAATTASPTVTTWLGVAGILCAGAALLAGRRFPRRAWTRRSLALAGAALIGLWCCNGMLLWPLLHEAVVLTAATPVRVSPVPMGDPIFELPEGQTVWISAQHEDFVLIETIAGRTGWVSGTNLAPVAPGGPTNLSF